MEPLVTVLTPVKDRREFLPTLVAQFLEQDYPEKELVIVNSGAPIAVHAHANVRVIDFPGTIGAALNEGIRQARGEYCIRFDDDDWQASDRIARQVAVHRLTGKAVVGLSSFHLWRAGESFGWRFSGDCWRSAGAGLSFRRQWGLAHPFLETKAPPAEDDVFTREAYEEGEYAGISGLDVLLVRNHDANDSGRGGWPVELLEQSDNFRKIPFATIQSRFPAVRIR